jgi:uncharacterized membrane protein YgdD (TMEM256/DUF423 family)
MIRKAAALSAALAIAAGAFGAHGATEQAAEWLRTGGVYLLTHAVAVWAVSNEHRRPAWCLLAGALIFSGTLFLMAFGAPRWLGAVTPIGGVTMIIGWLWIAARAKPSENSQHPR